MINVNIKALHILTKFMIQHMQKENHGYLLNVASVAGLLPAGPYMATYYATKSYVTSLTCAIAKELKDNKSDVYIGCLCPGPVQTEFNAKANVYFPLSVDLEPAPWKLSPGPVLLCPSLLLYTLPNKYAFFQSD